MKIQKCLVAHQEFLKKFQGLSIYPENIIFPVKALRPPSYMLNLGSIEYFNKTHFTLPLS